MLRVSSGEYECSSHIHTKDIHKTESNQKTHSSRETPSQVCVWPFRLATPFQSIRTVLLSDPSVPYRVALLERCRSYTSVSPSPPSRKSTKSTCAASAGNPATSTTWAGTRSRTSGAASRRRSARDHPRWPTPPNLRRRRRLHCEPSAQLLRVEAARPSRDRVRPHRSGTHGIARPRLSPRTSSRSRRRKVIDHTLYASRRRSYPLGSFSQDLAPNWTCFFAVFLSALPGDPAAVVDITTAACRIQQEAVRKLAGR